MEIFFFERFDKFLTQKNDFESTNVEMFEEVAHNFGKSDDDQDLVKKCLFAYIMSNLIKKSWTDSRVDARRIFYRDVIKSTCAITNDLIIT
jgi:hypothetical protein